jgi:hypothetical protein
VDLRVGLEDVEKRKFLILPGLELRPLGRAARRQSPYRLLYPGLLCFKNVNKIGKTVMFLYNLEQDTHQTRF